VTAMNVLVVGADHIGRELAHRLNANGVSVTLIDTDLVQVNQAQNQELAARQGDGTSADDLRKAGIEKASAFVATTSSDKTNLLACQIAMQRFGVENVSARVNNPDNMDNFASLGIKVVSPVVSTAMLLDTLVRRPAALELIASQVPGQEICEVELQNHRLIGKPLREWPILEGDVLVAMVRRAGELFVPHGHTVLEKGDTLTLIGKCEDVEFAQDVVNAE
jgi:Trk K+ transport system NAD-binding subunit